MIQLELTVTNNHQHTLAKEQITKNNNRECYNVIVTYLFTDKCLTPDLSELVISQ